MHIGLIAGSYKPLHAGHFGVITKASQENDVVKLFVSLTDRRRKGEVSILGQDMEKIWNEHLSKIMPDNVSITYGGSPIANVWKTLGEANESASADTYTIYSDPKDIQTNFPENSLKKYADNLWNNGQVILRSVERSETVDISGTKMRQFIMSGDKESFIANLPRGVDGNAIWSVLKKDGPTEALVRNYVKLVLQG